MVSSPCEGLVGRSLLVASVVVAAARGFDKAYYSEPVAIPTPCPGEFCGRTQSGDGNWTACGACPRGFRTNRTVCVQCSDSPTAYDWLFLGFMALLPLALHWFCIDLAILRRSFTRGVLVLHFTAFFETFVSGILALFLFEPRWSFDIRSCKVKGLSDWYTLLHNPSPGYADTLHCTQEAVYPLYTLVLVYYVFCLVAMLCVRPLVAGKVLPSRGRSSVYAALYFLPVLVVLQTVCGGLLYYAFPYMTVILSVISIAAHLAFKEDQGIKALALGTFTDVRNLVILLGHWTLHAYGIVAITKLHDIPFHAGLFALVPFPTIFYMLTVKCTDPYKLHLE